MTDPTLKPPPHAPKGALATIFLIVFIDLMGFGIVLPNVLLYGKGFGIESEFVLVMIGASYSLFQFLFAPLLGRWSDRVGRRPALIFSQAGTLLGFFILFAAHFFEYADHRWSPIGITLVFVSRIIDGASGGNISIASAYIADVTTPEKRAKGMGLIGAAFGLGFILGPAIGVVTAKLFGLHIVPVVAMIFSATALVCTIIFLKESRDPAHMPTDLRRFSFNTISRSLSRPVIGPLILMMFVNAIAFAGMEQSLPLIIYDRIYAPGAAPGTDLRAAAATGSGFLYIFIGLLIAVMQGGLIGRLTKFFGSAKLIIVGPMLIAIGLYLIAVDVAWPWVWTGFAVGSFFLAIGSSVFNPSVQAAISQAAGPHEQGEVLGASQGMASLARAFGPALAGLLYQFLSPGAPYFFSAALCALVAVWAVVLMRRPSSPV